MRNFQDVYDRLNTAQKQAVDTVEGPVLVIAGPGTGKTQLLSARVAQILRTTDTPAQNILCLTFTESGATNMRERLSSFIGQSAYDVTIGTYHSFGGDLIQRYPQYFNEARLEKPIDDLTKRQILQTILEGLQFDNPLRQARHHIGDLMTSMSEVKRALLTSGQLRAIASENLAFIEQANTDIGVIFDGFKSMPGYAKALPYFEQVLAVCEQLTPVQSAATIFGPLAGLGRDELRAALEQAADSGKTTPLTAWKNKWLAKDADNRFIMAGDIENRRILAMADIIDQYQAALHERGLYDFDDMIIKAIEVMEQNPDLKYTLQEKYLYILLDEFQDTNAAQLRLMQLLTDNPVHEGRPNILAVGDDDQAIYAFQGAQYSNMLDFLSMFRDVAVINLTENYRSHADVLHAAHNVATQIEGRLDAHFPAMTKVLRAANTSLPPATIERVALRSPIAERDWVARRIDELRAAGTDLREIAVLAPKHKYLEPLVPYLNSHDIPVRYEKRENILDAPVVRQLIAMSRLVLALHDGDEALAGALWPEVLSHACWHIPVDKLWQLSWQVRDTKGLTWSRALLERDDFRDPALLFLAVVSKVTSESYETILDYLTGTAEVPTGTPDSPTVCSPLRAFCTSPEMQQEKPELFIDTVSHLAVLRARLQEYQDTHETALLLADFVAYIDLHLAAEQQIMNTSPYNQAEEAVQLMTVYKAKGLEYQHVFLMHCEDAVWGSSARGNTNKLTLPANLTPIRHAGANDDERLRLLFVALTRAKHGLYLSSSEQQYSGRRSARLKYFDEREDESGALAIHILPSGNQAVQADESEPPTIEQLQLDWRTSHIHGLQDSSLRQLLAERVAGFQLSPTHVIAFLDLEYAGPQAFFLRSILNLPEAPSLDSIFGTVIHETLEWIQHQVSENEFMPDTASILRHYELLLKARKLTAARTDIELARGKKALQEWLKARQSIFGIPAVVERSFKHENVFVQGIHMSGRIDRMEINEKTKQITVVDYKTGKSYDVWKNDAKLYKYQLQLYLYKLLIERSRTYKDYTVTKGRLEFIEADDFGRIRTLELTFDAAGLQRCEQLVGAIGTRIQAVDFPDTRSYPATLTGMKKFEQNLLGETETAE